MKRSACVSLNQLRVTIGKQNATKQSWQPSCQLNLCGSASWRLSCVPRESRASKTWFWRSTHTPILGWSFGASFLARDQKVVLTSRDREGLPPRATLNLMDPSQTAYWTRTYRDDFQASSKPSRPTFVRVYTENNF